MSVRSVPDFDHWYADARPRLHASMVVACRDADLAADLTDEAFARALAHWRRVQVMASPIGWTYRVAHNLLRRRMRRRSMEAGLLAGLPVIESVLPSFGEYLDVWDAVAALPDRQRHAVVYRYVADRTEAEIAEILGVSRGTVASALHDARRSLAAVLGAHALPPDHGDDDVADTRERTLP